MAEIEYTQNLALAKQPTGAREWGAVLNENFDKIDAKAGNIQGSYNVGDIFYSMRTEQQFNGAALCDGASYSLDDFEGETTVKELLEAGKLPYVGLEEYESSLSSSGSCRAFGWDGGTEFRVPTLNDVFIQAGQATTPVEFLAESLPNITGSFHVSGNKTASQVDKFTGAFYSDYEATAVTNNYTSAANGTSSYQAQLTTLDASRSSAAYQDGAKVRPDSVRYSAYVQLASKVRDVSLQDYSSQLQETTDELNADIRLTGAETKNLIDESVEQAEKISDKVVYGNIGDIKYTARTDTPAGGFWCDGSTFDKQDLEQVYQMLVEGKLQSLPMDEYSTVVTENGSCGFFGLDTENKKFRVPLLNDVYLKAGQEAEVFGAESLPNIKGQLQSEVNFVKSDGVDGPFSFNETYNYTIGVQNSALYDLKRELLFDASRASSAYQDGAKVNPDHVKYRAYVILYLAEKELSIVNWANELTRFTETLKEELVAFGTTTITYWE